MRRSSGAVTPLERSQRGGQGDFGVLRRERQRARIQRDFVVAVAVPGERLPTLFERASVVGVPLDSSFCPRKYAPTLTTLSIYKLLG